MAAGLDASPKPNKSAGSAEDVSCIRGIVPILETSMDLPYSGVAVDHHSQCTGKAALSGAVFRLCGWRLVRGGR